MTAMAAENHIVRVGNGENSCCIGFLANISMCGADQFSSAELSQQTLFEAADESAWSCREHNCYP